MFYPLLTAKEQEVVVFPVFIALKYQERLLFGFSFIGAGLLLQYFWASSVIALLFSLLLVLVGNLFLVVRGYDNRIKFGQYKPTAAWEIVPEDKVFEIGDLVQRIKRWDRSWLDISNGRGGFLFMFLLFANGYLLFTSLDQENQPLFALSCDAFLLIVPHFITGLRSIQTQPNLLFKIKLLTALLQDKSVAAVIEPHALDYLMLLEQNGDRRVPSDVKFRLSLCEQPADFLGLYGQIVINRVGENKYPYFYVVAVARKGYGLRKIGENDSPSTNLTKEYKEEQDVEVLVLRQPTTKTSGYHTNHRAMRNILLEGVSLAKAATTKRVR